MLTGPSNETVGAHGLANAATTAHIARSAHARRTADAELARPWCHHCKRLHHPDRRRSTLPWCLTNPTRLREVGGERKRSTNGRLVQHHSHKVVTPPHMRRCHRISHTHTGYCITPHGMHTPSPCASVKNMVKHLVTASIHKTNTQ